MAPLSIAARLALVTVGAALLWRGALLLRVFDTASLWNRILQGAVITLGVLALMTALRARTTQLSRSMGMQDTASNLRACLLGAGLWLVPAALGTTICMALGWTSIDARAPLGTLILATSTVALGVMLIEALPEELLFRGFMQGAVARRYPAWSALFAQLALFVAFAWAIGALHSPWQWMFIPGFALILGYARALSGNVWTCIGIHLAWMTTTQTLAMPHFAVEGLQTLQFIAFALLPSAMIGARLGMRCPHFDWRQRAPRA